MILFFRTPSKSVIAVESNHQLTPDESNKLCWLFGEAVMESEENLKGCFVGPRREMITPWSTNAVEITQNMGLEGISRIEEYFPVKDENADYDPMLQRMYKGLDQNVFTTNRQPEPIIYIEDLEVYNEKEGLALSKEEMDALMSVMLTRMVQPQRKVQLAAAACVSVLIENGESKMERYFDPIIHTISDCFKFYCV